jgi:hypothetical protein
MKARLDGAAKRIKREHDMTAWLAWHVEALHRTKRLPKLRDMMMGGEPKQIPPQTPEQIESILRGWMAARRH